MSFKNNKIAGIGACVMDTLIRVPFYPQEDTKLKSLGTKLAGGGPVATGLAVAARLGTEAAYIGTLADDAAGRFLLQDFIKYDVSTEYINVQQGFSSMSCAILLSDSSKSRTCVFEKGSLPPLTLSASQMQAVTNAALLMVDGNELSAAVAAAEAARENGVKVLYDAGGLYSGVETLLKYADYLIPSEEFAVKHTGCNTAEEASKALYDAYRPQVTVVTCGKSGGCIYDGKSIKHYSALAVDAVDTNGAGDVFHGAFAAGLIKGFSITDCCHFAAATAALKCKGIGARESVPCLDEVMSFLTKRG